MAEAAGFEWRGRAKWGSEREDPAWSGFCGPPRQIKTDVTNGPNPRSRSPGLDQHSGLLLTITLVLGECSCIATAVEGREQGESVSTGQARRARIWG